MSTWSKPLRLGVFISGGGTTLEAILRAVRTGRLRHVLPVLVVSSRPDAGGIARALKHGMRQKDVVTITKRDFSDEAAFGDAILRECESRKIDAIWQCGWSVLTPKAVVQRYHRHIFNQHPGPLDPGNPDFGGQGMRGLAVHEAVLRFAKAVPRFTTTEATVHRVTEEYDKGNVVGRWPLPLQTGDTAETLAARLLTREHSLILDTIQEFALERRIAEQTRSRPLVFPEELAALEKAKAEAREAYPHG
jgi:phosphoribosylglycinamide formyltransferase-1